MVNGYDVLEEPEKVKESIGYLPEQPPLYPDMLVREYLSFVCDLKGVTKTEKEKMMSKVMRKTGIRDVSERLIKHLSKGYKQRVGLAAAMVGDPEILILDEPTAGLDPEERIRFRSIISALSQQKIVLLSTHIVSDIEAIANQVILLKKGSVLNIKQPVELLQEINGKVWSVTVDTVDEAGLVEKYPCSNIMHMDGRSVIRLLAEHSPSAEAVPQSPNMEDMYLYHFGQ